MSFYRNAIAAFAAVCFSASVFAAEEMNNMDASGNNAQAVQTSNAPSDAEKSTQMQQGKVNINTASLQELMNVKGMNRLKAKNIVRYRNQHLFKSLDELHMVKGFKKLDVESLKNIQEQLSVD